MLGRWPIVILCLVACGRPMFLLPSQGDPAWVEIRGEHFTLWTNTSLELGHKIARLMEERSQIIMTAMNQRSSSKAFLIGLRDERDVHVYTGEGFGGIFYLHTQEVLGEPVLLFHADPDDLERTVNHEAMTIHGL